MSEDKNYELNENDFMDLLSDFNKQIEETKDNEMITFEHNTKFVDNLLKTNKNNKNEIKNDINDKLNNKLKDSKITKKNLKDIYDNLNKKTQIKSESKSKSNKKPNLNKEYEGKKTTNKKKRDFPSMQEQEIQVNLIKQELKNKIIKNNDLEFKLELVLNFFKKNNIDLYSDDDTKAYFKRKLNKFIFLNNCDEYFIPPGTGILFLSIYKKEKSKNNFEDVPCINYATMRYDNGRYFTCYRNNKLINISKSKTLVFIFNQSEWINS